MSISAVYNSKIVGYAINGAQNYATEGIRENKILNATEDIIDSTLDKIKEILEGENIEAGEEENHEPLVPPAEDVITGRVVGVSNNRINKDVKIQLQGEAKSGIKRIEVNLTDSDGNIVTVYRIDENKIGKKTTENGTKYNEEIGFNEIDLLNILSCKDYTASIKVTSNNEITNDTNINNVQNIKKTVVQTAGDLRSLAEVVDRGISLSGETIVQLNDIDLGGTTFNPIGEWNSGTDYKAFEGEYNGGNKAITGLYINNPDSNGQALFAQNNGTIKNLTVSGSVTGGYCTGGICALNYKGTIQFCTNAVDVIGKDSITGGVCADSYCGLVTDSKNSGEVTGCYCVGGIVGKTSGISLEEKTKILNCTNTGVIYNNGSSSGGIVGAIWWGYGDIINCLNDVKNTSRSGVTGTYCVGGITGFVPGNCTVDLVQNNSSVTSTGYIEEYSQNRSYVGGLIGDCITFHADNNAGPISVTRGLNKGSVSGPGVIIGGVIGSSYGSSLNRITVKHLYNTGNVNGELDSNGYSTLISFIMNSTLSNCWQSNGIGTDKYWVTEGENEQTDIGYKEISNEFGLDNLRQISL